MCCSDDDCDADIFMFVLRCFVEKKNLRFVGRVFWGMVLDGIEGLSIEFNEVDDNNFNIVMVVLTAFFYLTLFFYIFGKYRRGEDVYTITFVFFFQVYIFCGSPHYFQYDFKF